MKHVIVGNGAAGTSAAAAVRKIDGRSEITILSEEAIPFYSRIRLIDYLAGGTDEQGLVIFRESWYEKNRIRLLLGRSVSGVDPRSGTVRCADGTEMAYDRLLVAAGGLPVMPPLPGSGKQGIFTLRSLDDARRIADYSRDVRSVVILGGGVLGIEVGNALRKRGKAVLIAEVLPRLLPRQTDPEASSVLQRLLEGTGLGFCLGAKAARFEGDGAVRGLLLEDGRFLEADMVVVSSGIRPRVSLLEGTGVTLGSGVVVNDRMETGVDGIYAAGDVAQHRGVVYGLWSAAEQQGSVAGAVMAGGDATYRGTVPSNSLKVAGVDLLSAGAIDADGKLDGIVQRDPERGVYRKLVFREGVLVGCILCGDLRGKREILEALQRGLTRHDLKQLLEDGGLVS